MISCEVQAGVCEQRVVPGSSPDLGQNVGQGPGCAAGEHTQVKAILRSLTRQRLLPGTAAAL